MMTLSRELPYDDRGGYAVRQMRVDLVRRGTSCIATILDDRAPRTADAVWERLPIVGRAIHAKWANNELFTLVDPFGENIGLENSTIVPSEGDVCFVILPVDARVSDKLIKLTGLEDRSSVADLSIFYGGNNLLLSPAVGFVPVNVFAHITEGLVEFAEACSAVFAEGWLEEELSFERV